MKKKFLSIVLSILITTSLIACGNNSSSKENSDAAPSDVVTKTQSRKEKNDFDSATNITLTFRGYDLSIPSSWTEGDNSTWSSKTYYAETGDAVAMFQLHCTSSPFGDYNELNNTQKETIMESYGKSFDTFEVLKSSDTKIGDVNGLLFDFSGSTSGLDIKGKVCSFVGGIGRNLINIVFIQSDNTEYSYFNDYEKILNSVTPTAFTSDDSTNEEAEEVPAIPLEYQNALSKAHSYLKFSAFSYNGLIEQLEYEKFSTEAATYAADNCGADWNEQAAKKAQSYLDVSSFSRQSLIEQLIYEGFSTAQAEYGVTSVGY